MENLETGKAVTDGTRYRGYNIPQGVVSGRLKVKIGKLVKFGIHAVLRHIYKGITPHPVTKTRYEHQQYDRCPIPQFLSPLLGEKVVPYDGYKKEQEKQYIDHLRSIGFEFPDYSCKRFLKKNPAHRDEESEYGIDSQKE